MIFEMVKRNRKLFFRDKGMFFSSLITPLILIVLYATFLARVYKDSFLSALPETMNVTAKLVDGTVAAQLCAALLAVSCITVTFCVNLTMVQDKAFGQRKDFDVAPIKRPILYLGYFISTVINSLLVNFIALVACLIYIAAMGWFLSVTDILLIIVDVVLLVLFGTVLSSIVCYPLKTQGQMSAVGTIVSCCYGFICGAYMPISNFGEGLQKVLSFLPGTYATSLIKNHMMRGVLVQMSVENFPDNTVKMIADSLDCNPKLFDTTISVPGMYLILVVTIVILLGLYLVMTAIPKKRR